MDMDHADTFTPSGSASQTGKSRGHTIEPDQKHKGGKCQDQRVDDPTNPLSFWRNGRVGSGVRLQRGRSCSRYALERRAQLCRV